MRAVQRKPHQGEIQAARKESATFRRDRAEQDVVLVTEAGVEIETLIPDANIWLRSRWRRLSRQTGDEDDQAAPPVNWAMMP